MVGRGALEGPAGAASALDFDEDGAFDPLRPSVRVFDDTYLAVAVESDLLEPESFLGLLGLGLAGFPTHRDHPYQQWPGWWY